MANGLNFSGNGFAVAPVSGLFQTPLMALEMYICTTITTSQALFSYGSVLIGSEEDPFLSTSSTLYINDQSQICFGVWGSAPNKSGIYTAVFENTTINDGNPHQITLLLKNAVPALYVDGQAVALISESSPQPYTNSLVDTYLTPSPGGQYSGCAFGGDAFNSAPLAPDFVGSLTELRIWTGELSGYVLTPPFSLNYGVPVSPKSPNLAYYWPFWTNPSAGTADLVGQCVLTLGPGVTVVSDIPSYYDPLSDVATFTQMSAFPDFAADTQPDAFNALMKAIDGSFTPTTFREQYLNFSIPSTFSDWYSKINSSEYISTGAYNAEDFKYVKSTLLGELIAVGRLCDYYSTAAGYNQYISDQYFSAASTVYATALASSITNDLQSDNAPSSFDAGDMINALTSAVSLGTSALSKTGPEGKVLSGFFQVIWKVITMYPPALPTVPTFTSTISLEANVATMRDAANGIVEQMNAGLTTALTGIAQNGGLLSAVTTRVGNGSGFAPPAFPTAQALDLAGYAATLFMVKVLVCTGFNIFNFSSAYTNISDSVSAVQQDPSTSLFYQALENPITGITDYTIVGYFVPDGPNGYPTVYSLTDVYDAMLNDAAQQLVGQNMTQDEVLSWSYTPGVT